MRDASHGPTANSTRSRLRHWLAFLLSGGIAFTVDAAVLKALTLLLGLHPAVARLFAISVAMLAGWLAHRTFTFALSVPPSLAEFLRYALVGWTVAAINYGVFAAIVLMRPATEPLIAILNLRGSQSNSGCDVDHWRTSSQ